MPCAPSAYKLEYSFNHRKAECASMLHERSNRPGEDGSCATETWVAIVVEQAANENSGGELLRRSRFLVPGSTTYAKFCRVLRRRLEYPSGQALFVELNGFVPSPDSVMRKIFDTEKDDDGWLYSTYTNIRPASLPPRQRKADPTAAPSVLGVQGRKARARGDKETGVELVNICSSKEQQARRRHTRNQTKRAAGPKETKPTNIGTSLQLASALSNLQLDTCIKGMLEVATKKSASPGGAQPSPYVGVGGSPNGAPCAIRVHRTTV